FRGGSRVPDGFLPHKARVQPEVVSTMRSDEDLLAVDRRLDSTARINIGHDALIHIENDQVIRVWRPDLSNDIRVVLECLKLVGTEALNMIVVPCLETGHT